MPRPFILWKLVVVILNPWESIPLSAYEAHMRLPAVGQLQALDALMEAQLSDFSVRSAAILGVAGGNGLRHIEHSGLDRVYGVDINAAYLDACRRRFSALIDSRRLVLVQCDLTDAQAVLPDAPLIIADLLLEYVGISLFCRLIAARTPPFVSCVIQQDEAPGFVSASPYAETFHGLTAIHHQIDEAALTQAMERLGYTRYFTQRVPLPNGKALLRLDFQFQASP